jgi:hypothetical protein
MKKTFLYLLSVIIRIVVMLIIVLSCIAAIAYFGRFHDYVFKGFD